MINPERLTISERNSVQSDQTGLIISAVHTFGSHAEIVVGRPGLPNLDADLTVGGAVLFETPNGVFEVRVMTTSASQVTVLVTHISPRPGIAAGYIDQNPENTPFVREELDQIAASIKEIKMAMSARSDITPEQMRYLAEKLDEMQEASERLGRKDWIGYAIGTFTSIVVTAAFDPSAAKALLQTAGAALSWLFGSGLHLLT
jgi:hypothetical protein